MNAKSETVRDDRYTVIAIAMLAVCTSDIAHEVIGHGSACLLSGQHVLLLNNAFFKCSGNGRYTAMAGPLGNLTIGLIAFIAQGVIPARRPAVRLYALLVMAFSLYWEAGYLIQAMVKDQGDSVFAYRELVGPVNVAVRVVAVLTGVMAYFLFARLLRVRSVAFASPTGRLSELLRTAWVTGVATMALAGALFSPDRLGAAHDGGLSIAASFPLLFMGASRQPLSGAAAAAILRNPWIIVLGLAVFAAFALTMGRGMNF